MHPIIFSFGPVHLYSYGLMVAIGVLSAIFLIRRNAKVAGLNPDVSVDLAMAAVISGFIGARIFYVVQQWRYFQNAPLDVFKIWQGGIVLYGGLIGGLIGFAVFLKLNRLPFLSTLDLFVPAMALAQGFGRLGCFLNGCCFGKECNLPWAVHFPLIEGKVHPTQIYESAFCFLLAAFLYSFWKKNKTPGKVALAYFTIYPIGRFVIEFFRGDQKHYLFGFTSAQEISLISIAVSLIIFLKWKLDHGKDGVRRTF